MVGKKSLTALCCASALLLSGAGSAWAADDGTPYEALVEVTVADQGTADQLVTNYDAAEYKRVNADGSVTLNLFVTDEEKAGLKAKGFKIGATIEDTNTGPQRMKERQVTIDAEALAAQVAENGLKGQKFQGQSVVPTPGDTVIQRANTFTDVVGPAGGTHDRALPLRRGVQQVDQDRSATARSPARRWRCPTRAPTASTARPTNMGRFVDSRPHAGDVHVPPAADPPARRRPGDDQDGPDRHRGHRRAAPRPASRRSRSRSGSARTSRRTSRASRTSRSSPSTWTRPRTGRTSTRSRRSTTDLMSVETMPEKTSGYQRKSQAIMNGTGAITAAPPVTLGATLVDTTGEITAAAPVATIPFNATAGTSIRATVDGIPTALDGLHPDHQGPGGHRPAVDRHGHEPGDHQPGVPDVRHLHVRGLGLPGRRRRLHVQDPDDPRPRASCSPPRTAARTAATRSWPSSAARPATTSRSASPSTASSSRSSSRRTPPAP